MANDLVFEQCAYAMSTGNDLNSQEIFAVADTGANLYNSILFAGRKDRFIPFSVGAGSPFVWREEHPVTRAVTVHTSTLAVPTGTSSYPAYKVVSIIGTDLVLLHSDIADVTTGANISVFTYNLATDTFSAVSNFAHGMTADSMTSQVFVTANSATSLMMVVYSGGANDVLGTPLAKVFSTITPASGWTLRATIVNTASRKSCIKAIPVCCVGRFGFVAYIFTGSAFEFVAVTSTTVDGVYALLTFTTNFDPILSSGYLSAANNKIVIFDSNLGVVKFTTDFVTFTAFTGLVGITNISRVRYYDTNRLLLIDDTAGRCFVYDITTGAASLVSNFPGFSALFTELIVWAKGKHYLQYSDFATLLIRTYGVP